MRIFKRQIRIGILLSRGIFYRCFIIFCNTIFNLLALKLIVQQFFAHKLGTALAYSIAWNIVNTGLYYFYHYFFDRHWKLGKD